MAAFDQCATEPTQDQIVKAEEDSCEDISPKDAMPLVPWCKITRSHPQGGGGGVEVLIGSHVTSHQEEDQAHQQQLASGLG